MTAPWWQQHPLDGALSVDEGAMDCLVKIFAECRELGIAIPEMMPLGDPACQRGAVLYLSGLVLRRKAGLE